MARPESVEETASLVVRNREGNSSKSGNLTEIQQDVTFKIRFKVDKRSLNKKTPRLLLDDPLLFGLKLSSLIFENKPRTLIQLETV